MIAFGKYRTGASTHLPGVEEAASGMGAGDMRASLFVQLQRVSESAIQFFLFTLGKRSNEIGELLFHHQSKKITSD